MHKIKYLVVLLCVLGLFACRRAAEKAAAPEHKNLGKTLIVYYSFTGNTKTVAEKVQFLTGADMHEVQTVETYPPAPEIYSYAEPQKQPGKHPALKSEIPDFSGYDFIIVGSPVWFYTVSAPMLSFLDKADFQGKKTAVFMTRGTNGGTFFEDFKKRAKNADMLESADFDGLLQKDPAALDRQISNWLAKLEKERSKPRP
jgi:flavodoxin